jgi:hypothetical protein
VIFAQGVENMGRGAGDVSAPHDGDDGYDDDGAGGHMPAADRLTGGSIVALALVPDSLVAISSGDDFRENVPIDLATCRQG